jgi:hypothetical protein
VKYHGETHLNNERAFKKMKGRNVKQILLGGGGRVNEGDDGG